MCGGIDMEGAEVCAAAWGFDSAEDCSLQLTERAHLVIIITCCLLFIRMLLRAAFIISGYSMLG